MAANVSDRAAAEAAARQAGVAVSRETQDRLVLYVSLLRRWNPVKNLVSPHTLSAVWERHIADCLQLAALAPDARTWVDLGSGGGLPGLVIAAVLAERAGTQIHLVESKLRQGGVPPGGSPPDGRARDDPCLPDRRRVG